ncbi:MAG: DUF3999 family protein [Thermomonas sp.]|uniref:DUF3999 family protein n=1 Tax=Thermomonas sp. TaxID=1971895 RepID=UPI002622D537|nr:DUF3999 family protein [Thermomonas sp.]MCC7096689.1 DUF3999 family protein [Thermomonas sp.]
MNCNRIGRWLSLALMTLPLALVAQTLPPYARQWQITLSRDDAGAYRVPLQADVYGAAYWPDLRDVRVIDADGKPVASTVHAAPAPTAAPLRRVPLRWFALPPRAAADGGTLALMVERSTDGTVVAIHDTSTVQLRPNVALVWLIDRGPAPARLLSLKVEWAETDTPVDVDYRLEGSDDLRDWQTLDPDVHLLQLRNQGQALRRDSAQVDTRLRYLRMVPLQEQGSLAVTGFSGEVTTPAMPERWKWLEIAGTAGANKDYHYALKGRYPIQRFEVVMPANSTASWNLASRDSTAIETTPTRWQPRAAGVTAWNLNENGNEQRSPPGQLDGRVGDQAWRLQQVSGAALAAAPPLRLGYQTGSVLFLAQGRAPYRLVAGSALASANHADLEPMLAELRTRRGAQWQPSSAALGLGSALAGDAAYTPAPIARDWKSLVLWGVLALGTLLVGGLALSLLRGQAKPTD